MSSNPSELTPEEFTGRIERALPLSIPEEQKRLIEHARAWAIVTYDGAVPEFLDKRLENMEERYGIA
jgi:hypothetical protein